MSDSKGRKYHIRGTLTVTAMVDQDVWISDKDADRIRKLLAEDNGSAYRRADEIVCSWIQETSMDDALSAGEFEFDGDEIDGLEPDA